MHMYYFTINADKKIFPYCTDFSFVLDDPRIRDFLEVGDVCRRICDKV